MAEPGLKVSLWVYFRAAIFPLPCLASVYPLGIIPECLISSGGGEWPQKASYSPPSPRRKQRTREGKGFVMDHTQEANTESLSKLPFTSQASSGWWVAEASCPHSLLERPRAGTAHQVLTEVSAS